MTQRFAAAEARRRPHACGAPIAPPFDKAAYLADTSSHGEWTVNGELLGDTVQLRDVVATRAKAPHVSGRVVAPRARPRRRSRASLGSRKTDGDDAVAAASTAPIGGPALGRAHRRRRAARRPGARARALPPRARPSSRAAGRSSRCGRRSSRSSLADDTLTMPPLEVTLDSAPTGFRGGFVLTGGVDQADDATRRSRSTRGSSPIDLAVLAAPRAEGRAGARASSRAACT